MGPTPDDPTLFVAPGESGPGCAVRLTQLWPHGPQRGTLGMAGIEAHLLESEIMTKKTAAKKRVVKNSAKTGNFTHKDARTAARKAAQKRTATSGKAKAR